MGHSTTFPRDTFNPEILKSYLMLLSEKVTFRMRKKGLEGRTVSLTIRYKDFTTFGHQHKAGEYLDDGYAVYRAALKMFESVNLVQPVRLLGVSVSDLARTPWQDFLFETMARRRNLNHAADQINKKFGVFTVRPASLIHAEKFGILGAPIPPFVAARRLYD